MRAFGISNHIDVGNVLSTLCYIPVSCTKSPVLLQAKCLLKILAVQNLIGLSWSKVQSQNYEHHLSVQVLKAKKTMFSHSKHTTQCKTTKIQHTNEVHFTNRCAMRKQTVLREKN